MKDCLRNPHQIFDIDFLDISSQIRREFFRFRKQNTIRHEFFRSEKQQKIRRDFFRKNT